MSYVDKFVKAGVFFASAVSALPEPQGKGANGEPSYPVMAAFCVASAVVAVLYCCCKRSERTENLANNTQALFTSPAPSASENYETAQADNNAKV